MANEAGRLPKVKAGGGLPKVSPPPPGREIKAKGCNCIALVNKAIEKDNAELVTHFQFDTETKVISSVLCLQVQKIKPNKRTKLPTICATFCPVCGKRLQP